MDAATGTGAAALWHGSILNRKRPWEDPERMLKLLLQDRDGGSGWRSEFQRMIDEFETRYDRDPAILDWHTGKELADAFEENAIFSPPTENPELPYLDHSIDIIVTPFADPVFLDEARRVARAAVAAFRIEEAAASHGTGVDLEVEWLSESDAQLPTVSIVVPVCDNLAYTRVCLAALRETLPLSFSGEVIVVDHSSTQDVWSSLVDQTTGDNRVRVFRSTSNQGFIEACNSGAARATGEILIFLNFDTIPLIGWFDALVRTFVSYPDAGVVGGKLVFPDGRLQQAGGVVFSDGFALQVGWGERDRNAPLFNHVRDVDYCSAALLATPRSLFTAIGGFDTRYRPAIYEDVDYCFAARKKGYRVYFQPDSVVIHFEDGAHGSGVSGAQTKYQAINRAKFAKKWSHTLVAQPLRPEQFDAMTAYRLASGGSLVDRRQRGEP